MMTSIELLERYHRWQFDRMFQSQLYLADVQSINKDDQTVTVIEQGYKVERICRLNAIMKDDDTLLVIYPKVGSVVMCGTLYNNKAAGLVLQVHSVDEIVWRKGERGGMLIPDVFLEELNKTNDYLAALKDATGTLATVLDSIATGTSEAFELAMSLQQLGDFSNVQDDKFRL